MVTADTLFRSLYDTRQNSSQNKIVQKHKQERAQTTQYKCAHKIASQCHDHTIVQRNNQRNQCTDNESGDGVELIGKPPEKAMNRG